MTDFVLEKEKIFHEGGAKHSFTFLDCVCLYANFINQTLTLGMFVPCDLEGNVLKDPLSDMDWWVKALDKERSEYCDKYEESKERVLFEGLFPQFLEDLKDGTTVLKPIDTIESFVKHSPTLTPSALKQIGL